MKVGEIVQWLELLAPPMLAQQWDNVGLLVGDRSATVSRITLCIDLTREVLAEAVRGKSQMVMAYHPIIFKAISCVTADATPIVYEAVRRGIAVYSVHTAFDVVPGGTNDVLAGAMGLKHTRPLESVSTSDQCKIVALVPPDDLSKVAEAAFAAGAGKVGNYHDCAFFSHGVGSFCGSEGSRNRTNPADSHEMAEEMRIEVIAPKSSSAAVCEAIRTAHSYEMPAIDVYPLESALAGYGMGRIGTLPRGATVRTLIERVKRAVGLKKLLIARATAGAAVKKSHTVTTAACGAGSCGALFNAAAAGGATFYLTGEMRHHDLLAANAAGLTVICLGHSNSERIALSALADQLRPGLDKVNLAISKRDKDPLEVV